MAKEWLIAGDWPQREDAAKDWSVPPLIAQILYNRGITDVQAVRPFLAPQLKDIFEPSELPGAAEAAEHTAAAIQAGQRITIYGDYDVDGITGTAILWHMLTLAGADVNTYVPHRVEEGYGINCEAIRQLHTAGTELIISVDCGVTACDAASLASELGVDLIITDHHCTNGSLPDCVQVVHPSAIAESPNPDLCGAAVALKVAWAIAQVLSPGERVLPRFRDFLVDAIGLAALGTIADVVALSGENRIIARYGLAGLPRSNLVGIQAPIESAGLTGKSIDSYDVGFKLAPRLNAAGRLGHARLAVEMLTRADETRAQEIATYLEDQNRARQKLEKSMLVHARELVAHGDMHRDSCRAIVLAHEGWHAGVIGIVASRLVDEFNRPAVLISLTNGVGQGSARSIRHFELNAALSKCSHHLLQHGGHAMAAGLKIKQNKVEAFKEEFVEIANNRLTAHDLIPKLRIDGQASLAELDDRTVRTIRDLGPFGANNPRPRLASGWLDLAGDPRCVGKSGDHLQFALSDNGVRRKAIGFGLGKYLQDLRDHRRCQVAFEPIINSYRGYDSVELQINDIRFPDS